MVAQVNYGWLHHQGIFLPLSYEIVTVPIGMYIWSYVALISRSG